MTDDSIRAFTVTAHGRAYPTAADGPGSLGSLRCPVCDFALNLHQPEMGLPHRLLASCTCEECGLWFHVALPPDRATIYLLRMPELFEIRQVMGDA